VWVGAVTERAVDAACGSPNEGQVRKSFSRTNPREGSGKWRAPSAWCVPQCVASACGVSPPWKRGNGAACSCVSGSVCQAKSASSFHRRNMLWWNEGCTNAKVLLHITAARTATAPPAPSEVCRLRHATAARLTAAMSKTKRVAFASQQCVAVNKEPAPQAKYGCRIRYAGVVM